MHICSTIRHTLTTRYEAWTLPGQALLVCALLAPLSSHAQAPAQAQPQIASTAPAQTALTLEQVMADPDWIGNPVERAWWSVSGEVIYYQQQRNDSNLRDVYAISPSGDSAAERLALAARANINDDSAVYAASGEQALYLRQGDVWLRDLRNEQTRALTISSDIERGLAFSSDARQAMYRRGNNWYSVSLDGGAEQLAADLRMQDDPAAEPDQDFMQQRQLRLFTTLNQLKQQREAQQQQEQQLHQASSEVAVQPWYLGQQYQLINSSLAPDGRHLLVITTKAQAEAGRRGKMPVYVTESGYVDIEDVHTRVGANAPAEQQLWLLDLEQHEQYQLDFSVLPGVTEDPLADLRQQQDLPALEGSREVMIRGIQWHDSGSEVAIQIQAIDNKDRWLTTLDLTERKLQPRHRLTDPAWINWSFNEFGWLPGREQPQLWFLSEQDGYAHLYTLALDQDRAKQRSHGNWELSAPQFSRDGAYCYFIANRERAAEYELYRLQLSDDSIVVMTDLDGVNGFQLDADQQNILVSYSSTYLPQQIAVIDAATRAAQLLSDTRTERYRNIAWQQPEFVAVPSRHGASQPIWSKLYLPDATAYPGARPIVLFVHGAGYTQNTHLRYPYYFREQMFHNLLSARGYIVLDMDYRASAGYGRDWRTAIYRQMGHPELEDLLDGIDWLAEHHAGDKNRVGIYGGSYGGFMSLMAMFRAPESFTAGAALRPVTDWTSYNHSYTANILNTPKLDPEAYRISSPIDHADGLQGHLLIAHGMLDDNVFYQDSVRLAQRLIELHKDNWELASYPLEAHGFEHADSWYDEYRRILALFERTLNSAD